MSILIKGMEMPTSCKECRLTYDSSWCLLLDEPNECVEGGLMWKRCAETGRLEDCPLDPVQPHGRLIDEEWLKDAMITTLEALKKNPKMDRQEMHLIAAFDTLRAMIEDAPTIIEAEVAE